MVPGITRTWPASGTSAKRMIRAPLQGMFYRRNGERLEELPDDLVTLRVRWPDGSEQSVDVGVVDTTVRIEQR